MNNCNAPFYLRPYAWFLFICIVLFIIFVCVIEFSGIFNANEAFPEWIIILFFVLIGFLFTSFIMYYWFNNKCRKNAVVTTNLEDTYINCQIEDGFIYTCH